MIDATDLADTLGLFIDEIAKRTASQVALNATHEHTMALEKIKEL